MAPLDTSETRGALQRRRTIARGIARIAENRTHVPSAIKRARGHLMSMAPARFNTKESNCWWIYHAYRSVGEPVLLACTACGLIQTARKLPVVQ